MIVEIDDRSPVPAYEQLRTQIATMIATGVLNPQDRLPPIRQLAADLDLSNNTVARAYRELERDHWVTTRGRHGTIVSIRPSAAVDPNTEAELDNAARAFAVRAAQLGVPPADAIQAAQTAVNNTRLAT